MRDRHFLAPNIRPLVSVRSSAFLWTLSTLRGRTCLYCPIDVCFAIHSRGRISGWHWVGSDHEALRCIEELVLHWDTANIGIRSSTLHQSVLIARQERDSIDGNESVNNETLR